jgi:Ribosomal protein L11, RNA binding domain
MPDLNATTIEAAMRIVEGTAKNMGLKVGHCAKLLALLLRHAQSMRLRCELLHMPLLYGHVAVIATKGTAQWGASASDAAQVAVPEAAA